MTAVDRPELSVILPAKSGATIETTLKHLRAQIGRERLELVLVTETAAELDLDARALEGFNSTSIVETGAFDRISQAFGAGVRAATAPAVVMAEDHSYPEPGWATALLRRHEGPWAAVGPAIVCANPDSTLGWADLLLSFGRWVERDEGTEADVLPSHNSSYKRAALLEYGPRLDDMIEIEHLLHANLRARGRRLYFEPAARTRHVNITRTSTWISNRFFGGWVFAVLRSREWSWRRRAVYAGGSPLLPAVRLVRVARDLRRINLRHRLLPRVLPALVLGVVLESAGELVGYVLAERVTVRKPLDPELDRLRHVQASRQPV
ncbi:MAG: glycosyltransferase [Gaiellaceae bacterium]